MKLRFYSTVTLLMLTQLCINAQNVVQTVKGKITDIQSNAPIIGANVVIANTDPLIGATTDENGFYTISGVPIGRHHIKVTFIGYEDVTLPEVLVGSGKEVVINAKLRESLLQMDEIVINAAEQQKGEPLNEMALISAKSFSVEETTRYAATFDDPARAALSFPGVTGGGDDISNEIVIRGNSPRGLLWRVEGVEVPNPNHFADEGSSAGAVSMLSTNMLSNSDFYTGAFPAEYGNALSGVFDINLRQGNSDQRESAFQAGLLGLAFSTEGPFSKKSKSSYLLNYRYSTVGLFSKLGIDIIDENEEAIFQDFAYKFHFPTKKLGTFQIWGIGGASDFAYKADTSNNDFIDEISVNQMLGTGLSHIIYLTPNTYLKSILSYSRLKTQFFGDSLGSKVLWDESYIYNTYRASFLLNQKLSARSTLRSGAIFNFLDFDILARDREGPNQPLTTYVNQDGNSQTIQLYSQWQYRVNTALTINMGMHFSHFRLNNESIAEPRLSYRWQFTNKQAFTGGFGLHSRLEPISLYFAEQQINDVEIVQPNRTLKMTKASHLVLGYENKLKSDLKLKTEAYYQHLYDVPIRPNDVKGPFSQSFSTINYSGGFVTDTLVSNGTGTNYGIELSLEKYFTNRYYFTITSSLFNSKYVAADNIERNTRFNTNFVANLLVGKEFKVGKGGNNLIGINSRVIWSGGQRVFTIDLDSSIEEGRTVYDWDKIYDTQLPNYFRIDLGIRYQKNKPGHASIIALNVQNFTGRYNVYNQYYSRFAEEIRTDSQLGIFPNLSYRIEF